MSAVGSLSPVTVSGFASTGSQPRNQTARRGAIPLAPAQRQGGSRFTTGSGGGVSTGAGSRFSSSGPGSGSLTAPTALQTPAARFALWRGFRCRHQKCSGRHRGLDRANRSAFRALSKIDDEGSSTSPSSSPSGSCSGDGTAGSGTGSGFGAGNRVRLVEKIEVQSVAGASRHGAESPW